MPHISFLWRRRRRTRKRKHKKCYIDTDGRHVDFKYAYLSIDEPSYSGGLYEYELEFSNIDYFYYTKKQEEIIGKKVSLQSSLLFHLRNMTLILFLKEIFLFKHIIVVKKMTIIMTVKLISIV